VSERLRSKTFNTIAAKVLRFKSKAMRHRKDAGFSIAALIFLATAVSILIAAAYPAYQMQARREMEEELIFRGEEYARAIQKFHRKFNVYPPSLDALLETNGLRFLRRPYKDPMTGKDFRVIFLNPDGTLTGSTLATQRINNTPLFGAPLQMMGSSPSAQPGSAQPVQPQGTQPGQPRSPGQPTQGSQPGGFGQPGLGQPGQPSGGFGQPSAGFGQPSGGFGQPSGGFGQPGGLSQAAAGQPSAGQPRQPAQGTQPGFQQPAGGTTGSVGVVGVGSDSTGDSIKVYNTRQKYNEWEFIAITNQPGSQPPGTTPPPPGSGQTPPGQTPPGQSLSPFGTQPPPAGQPPAFKR
jgi:type II secretory pathway pseudopilin PulG